jgi:CubicO group peptidase (beta-lactamase class C family)
MRNYEFIFLMICTVFLLSGCSKRPHVQADFSKQQLEILKEFTSSFPENTQLAIAILDDSSTNYYGILVHGDTLLKINNCDSVFEIGSISKVFTSAILSYFLLNNRVQIDGPVEPFLPFNLKKDNNENYNISFRTLANHTSGLPRMPDNYALYPESSHDSRAYSKMALQEYLEKDLAYISVPGKDYNYSNLGYGILGYSLTQISRKNYESLLQKIVCRRYKLKSTTTAIHKIDHKLVAGQDQNGNKIEHYDLGVLSSSGGVFSNVIDLAKFVRANFKKDTLLSLQQQETYGWGNFGVALGWHIYKIGGENCWWYYHNGGMEGYRSSIYMDVVSKKGVVILSNLSTFHRYGDNIDRLADALLKNEYMLDKDNTTCIAPFLELALKKGWGAEKRDSLRSIKYPRNSIYGVWEKANDNRNNIRTFFPNHKVQTNIYGDEEIDVWGFFTITGNEIQFTDIGGAACSNKGNYYYEIRNDTLRFTEISDECQGREIGLSGSWIRSSN